MGPSDTKRKIWVRYPTKAWNFPTKVLDRSSPLWYTMRMKWNQSTVPVSVEERHDLSVLIGKAFALSYSLHTHCEQTTQLLDMYREARRMVDTPPQSSERYGAYDAYLATQG